MRSSSLTEEQETMQGQSHLCHRDEEPETRWRYITTTTGNALRSSNHHARPIVSFRVCKPLCHHQGTVPCTPPTHLRIASSYCAAAVWASSAAPLRSASSCSCIEFCSQCKVRVCICM
jgi:hypothetical protein